MSALKVNNREVPENELLSEWDQVKKTLAHDPSSQVNHQQLTLRYAKENIINRILLEEEAELLVDEIEYKIIQAEYEKLLSHYQGWDNLVSKFPDATPHKIKANIEKSLKVSRLLEMWTDHVNPPNEAEMMSYYERHREKFVTPHQILFSRFFLPHSPQNKILMEGIFRYKDELKNYNEFVTKVRQIPGLVYQEKFYLGPKQINAEVDAILRGLDDEELSGIIQTDEGYNLFKRWSALPPRELEYDAVRTKIEKILWEEKKQKRIREKLNQIRSQAVIEDFYQPQSDVPDA